MGILQTKDTNSKIKEIQEYYTVGKHYNDPRYGEGKILGNKSTGDQVLMKEISVSDEVQFKKWQRKLESRQAYASTNIIKLICISITPIVETHEVEEKQLCSNYFKIFILFEFIPDSLQTLINAKKLDNKHFTEDEMWVFLIGAIKGLSTFQSHNIAHQNIRTQTLSVLGSIDDQTLCLKICDTPLLTSLTAFVAVLQDYSEHLKGYYLAPTLVRAVFNSHYQPMHNPYKSDVFSLGMTLLSAALLLPCDCCFSFTTGEVDESQIDQFLQTAEEVYSQKFMLALRSMLKIKEEDRPDFVMLKDIYIGKASIESPRDQLSRALMEDLSHAQLPQHEQFNYHLDQASPFSQHFLEDPEPFVVEQKPEEDIEFVDNQSVQSVADTRVRMDIPNLLQVDNADEMDGRMISIAPSERNATESIVDQIQQGAANKGHYQMPRRESVPAVTRYSQQPSLKQSQQSVKQSQVEAFKPLETYKPYEFVVPPQKPVEVKNPVQSSAPTYTPSYQPEQVIQEQWQVSDIKKDSYDYHYLDNKTERDVKIEGLSSMHGWNSARVSEPIDTKYDIRPTFGDQQMFTTTEQYKSQADIMIERYNQQYLTSIVTAQPNLQVQQQTNFSDTYKFTNERVSEPNNFREQITTYQQSSYQPPLNQQISSYQQPVIPATFFPNSSTFSDTYKINQLLGDNYKVKELISDNFVSTNAYQPTSTTKPITTFTMENPFSTFEKPYISNRSDMATFPEKTRDTFEQSSKAVFSTTTNPISFDRYVPQAIVPPSFEVKPTNQYQFSSCTNEKPAWTMPEFRQSNTNKFKESTEFNFEKFTHDQKENAQPYQKSQQILIQDWNIRDVNPFVQEQKNFFQTEVQRQEVRESEKARNNGNDYGRFEFENGGYYEGNFKDGRMTGIGTLYYVNGSPAYEGQWLNDKFEGQGTLYNDHVGPGFGVDHKDLDSIEDSWTKYIGGFKNDCRHGYGTIYMANGDRYEGTFEMDVANGPGTYFKKSGQIVTGMWLDNKLRR